MNSNQVTQYLLLLLLYCLGKIENWKDKCPGKKEKVIISSTAPFNSCNLTPLGRSIKIEGKIKPSARSLAPKEPKREMTRSTSILSFYITVIFKSTFHCIIHCDPSSYVSAS